MVQPNLMGYGAAPAEPAMTRQDDDQLKLLSVFQFVYGGLIGLMALVPIIYVIIGVAMLAGSFPGGSSGGPPPPAAMGWFFVGIGGAVMVLGLLMAALNVLSGLYLRRRTHRMFCMVIGAIDCLNMPLGTALGVFVLIVLSRPGVRAAFERPPGELPYGAG